MGRGRRRNCPGSTLLYDSKLSDEIEGLKTQLQTRKNLVAVLEADVKL